ncbi:MAG: hypothetical protein ABIG61_01620 [Planctomycetota bacterium]
MINGVAIQTSNYDRDNVELEGPVGTEKGKIPEIIQRQDWDELVSTGLSFLDKLGRTLHGREGQQQQPISKMLSGLKIETDKATGQQHLKLPIPSKEIFTGLANLLNELSKRM